jgi:hypothetical protein
VSLSIHFNPLISERCRLHSLNTAMFIEYYPGEVIRPDNLTS